MNYRPFSVANCMFVKIEELLSDNVTTKAEIPRLNVSGSIMVKNVHGNRTTYTINDGTGMRYATVYFSELFVICL